MDYQPRIVDREIDELLAGLPAIALEGPKAVGKTETALRTATTSGLVQPRSGSSGFNSVSEG